MKKVAVVDFDDTICNPAKPWPAVGTPKKGARAALQKIRDMGFEIHILSCRTDSSVYKYPIDRQEQVRKMEAYLDENEIPYDVVLNKDKPVAHVYIDDRGIGFRDDWEDVVKELENMEDVKWH